MNDSTFKETHCKFLHPAWPFGKRQRLLSAKVFTEDIRGKDFLQSPGVWSDHKGKENAEAQNRMQQNFNNPEGNKVPPRGITSAGSTGGR